jgi:adenylate cyclase class 2
VPLWQKKEKFLKEIEVKILEINVEGIEEKLKEMGAEKVFEGEMVSIYFDFPDKSLEKEGKILRLRQKEDKVILTYKELISQDEAKIMDEYELTVSDFESLKRIFEGIGLLPLYEFNKHRITYQLNQTHFEIDKYPEIPVFLEIEAPDLNTINEIVSELGFSKEEVKSYSIRDVLKYYGKIRS